MRHRSAAAFALGFASFQVLMIPLWTVAGRPLSAWVAALAVGLALAVAGWAMEPEAANR